MTRAGRRLQQQMSQARASLKNRRVADTQAEFERARRDADRAIEAERLRQQQIVEKVEHPTLPGRPTSRFGVYRQVRVSGVRDLQHEPIGEAGSQVEAERIARREKWAAAVITSVGVQVFYNFHPVQKRETASQ